MTERLMRVFSQRSVLATGEVGLNGVPARLRQFHELELAAKAAFYARISPWLRWARYGRRSSIRGERRAKYSEEYTQHFQALLTLEVLS